MSTDHAANGFDRLEALERRQRRTTRWLAALGVVVGLQAIVIAYLVIPFGTSVKHPVTVQAGRFEVIDRSGTVRAVLASEYGQTMLAMHDKTGRSQILLRENDEGFAVLEFYHRPSDQNTVTLLAGSKKSYLRLRDPGTMEYLSAQAGEGEMGLMRLDERGNKQP
jgi:hypothetical protein